MERAEVPMSERPQGRIREAVEHFAKVLHHSVMNPRRNRDGATELAVESGDAATGRAAL